MKSRGLFSTFIASLMLATALSAGASAFPSSEDGISAMQERMRGADAGERIAAWAESFVGTPYDPDPLGLYVSTNRIVADESVDCMYHTFRSVELALSNSPAGAVDLALGMRFRSRGVLGPDGLVLNYGDRYQYGMDMVRGGRWGEDITGRLGKTSRIKGERGLSHVDILPKGEIGGSPGSLKSGDIVFFIKDPGKRVVGEIVGHIGIIKVEGEKAFLIHASGRKNKGGMVVKVPFAQYAADMPFIGILVTRFE
jgi:hypothetical protein